MKWAIALGVVGVSIFIGLFFLILSESKTFEIHNCVKTDEYQVIPVTTTTIVGKVIIPITTMQTQYKYTCDDTVRWR